LVFPWIAHGSTPDAFDLSSYLMAFIHFWQDYTYDLAKRQNGFTPESLSCTVKIRLRLSLLTITH